MPVDFEALAGWAADSSPLYERLCTIVAEDEELLTLADHVPEGRATANVFMAALHYRILRGADHPLADYYPSVRADPKDPDDYLADALRDFCRTYEDDLVPLLERRRTQTNAVRRCGALYPAFCHVTNELDGDEPIAFVEIGPSAGLNLNWDRYRYDYDGRIVGASDSPVTIETHVRGEADSTLPDSAPVDPPLAEPPLADVPPAVHSRVGVDLNPMDVTDLADADWLRALVWPEQRDRQRVLEGAIEIAREEPPRVVEGDAVTELPALLDEIPAEVPIVVYNTLVLYQMPEDVRADLRSILESAMAERPLHWLSGDGIYGDSDGITLEWTRREDGTVRTDLLAPFEQHGEWLAWRSDASPVSDGT